MDKHLFENIRRIQEIIERMNLDQIQNQFKAIDLSYYRLIESMRPKIEVFNTFAETLRQQQEILKSLSIEHRIQLAHWQEIINQLKSIKELAIPIPNEIYPRLDELFVSLRTSFPIVLEGKSDLTATITVKQPQTHEETNNLTWYQFLTGILIPLIIWAYTIFSDYQTYKQNEELIQKIDELMTFIELHIPEDPSDSGNEDNGDESVE